MTFKAWARAVWNLALLILVVFLMGSAGYHHFVKHNESKAAMHLAGAAMIIATRR